MPGDRLIYLVDDDEAVRDSLSLLLETTGFTVRCFASAREFLAVASSLRPGVVISDIQMPEMDGLQLQQRLNELGCSFPLVIMTGHADVPLAVQAIKAGALDLIEKPFAADAILNVAAAALDLLAARNDGEPLTTAAAARLALLTPREREVLESLLAGLPNKSIAYDLAISPRTVEIHRARVMDKMGARSVSELVQLSLAAGIRPRLHDGAPCRGAAAPGRARTGRANHQ